MKIELSVSGPKEKARQDLLNQAKQAGKANEASWPTIASARDHALKAIDAAPAGAHVTVVAKLEVSVKVVEAPATPPVPAAEKKSTPARAGEE